MEKIKKLWKEISVFGIVVIVFIGLFAYNKIMYTDYSTISEAKLAEKIKDKDSFVVVVGSNSDNNTISYQTTMQTFVDKNRDESLYYVDLAENKDAAKFIKETFNTDVGTIPQTFVVKNGEVVAQRDEVLTYSRLLELYKLK